jgi:hypothetical protein
MISLARPLQDGLVIVAKYANLRIEETGLGKVELWHGTLYGQEDLELAGDVS